MVWVEDRAEHLILTTLAVLVAVIGTLLLWKTARVISLAVEFKPVLESVAAVTTILLGVLNILKSRRDGRQKEAAAQPPPPLPPVKEGTAQPELPTAPEPQTVPGGPPPTLGDSRDNSA